MMDMRTVTMMDMMTVGGQIIEDIRDIEVTDGIIMTHTSIMGSLTTKDHIGLIDGIDGTAGTGLMCT